MKNIIIIIMSFIILVMIGLVWFSRPMNAEPLIELDQQVSQDEVVEVLEEIVIVGDEQLEILDVITLPIIPRGDIVYQPIEDDCQGRLESYIESLEFSKSEFSKCELIESREGMGDEDCPNGFSTNGCSICKLKCE